MSLSLFSGECPVHSEEAPTPEARGHPHRHPTAQQPRGHMHIPCDFTRLPAPSRESALPSSSKERESSRCAPAARPTSISQATLHVLTETAREALRTERGLP